MKICPQCNAEFNDNVTFCLNDGSPLGAQSQRDIKTENFSVPIVDGPPTQPNPTVGYTPPATDVEEEQTVAQTAAVPARRAPPQSKSRTILLVVLGICLLAIIVVVLGVAGVLYYLVYKQPEVATANTNSIIINNVNAANSDTGSSNTNVIALNTDTNSGLPSNSLSVSTANTNAAANRRVTPTPTRTVDTRPTPEIDEPPPPPTPRSVPSTISGGVLNGKAISLPKPAYPPAARAVRAGGSVNVQVLIDETGRVVSAHAISGNPLLIPAAEVAARGARFSPTLLSGQPVKVSGIITYNFVP